MAEGGCLKVSLDLPQPDLRSRNSSVSICTRGTYANAGQGASYEANEEREGSWDLYSTTDVPRTNGTSRSYQRSGKLRSHPHSPTPTRTHVH